MKCLISKLLFLSLSINLSLVNQSLGQKKEAFVYYPFKIVHANAVFDKYDWPVKSNDTFRLKDSLTIKNGSLMLAHYSGQLFEFNSDTILSLQKLANSLTYDRYSYEKQFFEILNDTVPQKRMTINRDLGMICRPVRKIEVIYPKSNKVNIPQNTTVFIQWFAIEEDNQEIDYRLTISNIFDETLESFVVHGNETKINFNELSTKHDDIFFVISISFLDGRAGKNTIAYEITEELNSDSEFSYETSIKSLQHAASLEAAENYLEAHEYYKKATKLSTNDIYGQFLKNFTIRKKKYESSNFQKF